MKVRRIYPYCFPKENGEGTIMKYRNLVKERELETDYLISNKISIENIRAVKKLKIQIS
jgi:hypothetical protein